MLLASLGGLATALVLIFSMSSPSVATPDRGLDAAAVSDAIHDAALTLFPAASVGTPPPASADGVGAFDPTSAAWHLRTRGGDPTVFFFGDIGAVPVVGDWDGDGIDTVGTFDSATATVSLRNTNTAGEADVSYRVGEPGDVPLAGDFDGDGVDSISVFRPSDGFVYIYNASGSEVGEPAATYAPAGGTERLVAGDFDGDTRDTIAAWDPATGTVIASTPGGAMASEFTLSTAGSHIIAGDWTGDGQDSTGTFDAEAAVVHLRYANADGAADESYSWGSSTWVPVAGHFGELDSRVITDLADAPQGLTWAIESLYLEFGNAPDFDGEASRDFTSSSVVDDLTIEGNATTAEGYDSHIAVVTTDTDTILAASDDGWSWRIVGGTLPSQGFTASATSPRFVTIIGSDYSDFNGSYPATRVEGMADSIHIFGVNPAGDEGAIVGILRDTVMAYDGPLSVDGMAEISFTMRNQGPAVPTSVIANETGLPIEGYFATGFGSALTPFPGFQDLVDAFDPADGLDFLVPYSTPSQCVANPPAPYAAEGDTHIDGRGALAFSRERKCIPTDPDTGSIIDTGNVVRTLSQGLLMKAAIAQVQKLDILMLPNLIALMKTYVDTNLSDADILTLAEDLHGIDLGPMPTLTPDNIADLGIGAYDLNHGDLPNVVVEGCNGYLTAEASTWLWNQFYVSGNYGTFADFADGTLDTLPVYRYVSPDPNYRGACPWLLPSSVTRIAGSNRFETAAEISKSKFSPGTQVAYIATGFNFPDALAAGPVAALNRGPILLVDPNSIPSATAAELARLKPARIVIVGGTAAVSAAVESQLAKYTSGAVTRLAGSNRYATGAEISKSKFSPGVPVVHIATGLNFPDALAGGPVAALNGGPILLVDPNSIPSATAAELSRLKPGRISIVGGTAAVSAAVESQLAKYTTGSVTRLAAANRFATAAEISKAKFSPGVATVYVATGLNFPDALAGGPAAGYGGISVSPILLVDQNSIPSATRTELTRLQPHSIIILGGSAVVSDKVMSDLAEFTAP